MGAKNAGHLAAAILALHDERLRRSLKQRRAEMARDVLQKAEDLPQRLEQALRAR
jgi:phosphoribosylcarboxyaminoimidazole (NCAIR) mutase